MNTEEFLEHQKRIMIDAINETTNKNSTEGLRDYFAAAALQGLLANPKLADEIKKQGGAYSGWIERSSYSWADSMLKERERWE